MSVFCLVQRFPLATIPSWLSTVRITMWGSSSWDQRHPWLQVPDLPLHCHVHLDFSINPWLIYLFIPLGIVDDLTAAGVACFGPSSKAARLEASKSYSKAFMERHGIPTARYGSFTDPQQACNFIRTSVHTETAITAEIPTFHDISPWMIEVFQSNVCLVLEPLNTDVVPWWKN